ncbi:glycoside hydrolase family 15 protein [Nocardia amamiensis]|uniref:Glycoside hydrolase family 15 protein n=1 Tax=Nocardia amamiensis TaxID=404578 RepID=A0ABS0CMU2_9NOCA|nr:glycoside hydrolase family 15 protein [Nocardia amamiensis]MBF6297940.1 glycoside hydrolase family 15 protein [Nocardia amamiensis]
MSDSDYALISDHGLIGDLQTAALVAKDGTIDFFCAPRFDSPSIFASLLDARKGGRFRITSTRDDTTTNQIYFPQSACLITRFMSEAGIAELVDFMPVDKPTSVSQNHKIVRVVRCLRGEIPFRLECEPRFDFARKLHELSLTSEGAVFRANGQDVVLHGAAGVERAGDDGVRLDFSLEAGEIRGFLLETAASRAPQPVSHGETMALFDGTVRYWRGWLGKCTYQGRWREMVHRSAMSLKLMTYAPTGALVASPTVGLPEQLGGERNWDYRYTWIRDASASVYALVGLGYIDEATAFLEWVSDRVSEQVGVDSGPLKIMYRVDGSSDLTEETLHHFEGYKGSRPVRIGNGAADQLQLDVYGEVMDAIALAEPYQAIGYEDWLELTKVLDWLCENWDQPDEGVWETRGGRQDFTYGRVMSWVALDRGIRMAESRGRPGDVRRWASTRDAVSQQVMRKCWNPSRRAFTQHPGTHVLDASNLLMPLVGFVAPKDPLWLSTLDAMNEELVTDSLVYRYNPSASPDGLRGSEGTFSLCSFFYVDALTRAGRLEEAQYAFEKMLTYANHLGLYSEEIDPSGHQVGNFPQAFTHLALIHAALDLDAALNFGPGPVFQLPGGLRPTTVLDLAAGQLRQPRDQLGQRPE